MANDKIFQAYALNGKYMREFDLKEIARMFEERHGYKPKEIFVTAGGSTCLAGPLSNGKVKDE